MSLLTLRKFNCFRHALVEPAVWYPEASALLCTALSLSLARSCARCTWSLPVHSCVSTFTCVTHLLVYHLNSWPKKKFSFSYHIKLNSPRRQASTFHSVMSQLKVHIRTFEVHDEQKFAGREGHAGEVLVRFIRETEHV